LKRDKSGQLVTFMENMHLKTSIYR